MYVRLRYMYKFIQLINLTNVSSTNNISSFGKSAFEHDKNMSVRLMKIVVLVNTSGYIVFMANINL